MYIRYFGTFGSTSGAVLGVLVVGFQNEIEAGVR